MKPVETNHITIDVVDGPNPGPDLMRCFFVYDSRNHTYDFYDKHGNLKNAGLKAGDHFHFRLNYEPGIEWDLSMSHKSNATSVEGKWKHKDIHQDLTDSRDPEPDQSYQAQAGGSVGDEVNAAVATA